MRQQQQRGKKLRQPQIPRQVKSLVSLYVLISDASDQTGVGLFQYKTEHQILHLYWLKEKYGLLRCKTDDFFCCFRTSDGHAKNTFSMYHMSLHDKT
jgi:hypothetical protein